MHYLKVTTASLYLLLALFTIPTLHAQTEQQDVVDTAIAAGDFGTLAQALTAADLITTLQGEGPFTVFAPNDAAFAKIPAADLTALLEDTEQLTKVLTFHVVLGRLTAADLIARTDMSLPTVSGIDAMYEVTDGMVKVEGATVIQADIAASNGIIHVIDTVLMPTMPPMAEQDIIDTAIAAGDFTTLASALTAANLIETLRGEGPFTVFAPNDQAFESLGDLEPLLADSEALTNLLTFHVVPGKLMAADLVAAGMGMVTTVEGRTLKYEVSEEGAVMVGNATVIQADIAASNGVIHIVDKVLMPERDCKATFDQATGELNVPCVIIVGEEMGLVYDGLLRLDAEGRFLIEASSIAP